SDMKGRVLLPVLGDQYGAILEKGEIELRFDAANGSFCFWYYEHRFPVSPFSYAEILRAGGNGLEVLAGEFDALRTMAPVAARDKAAKLKHQLAEAAQQCGATPTIDAALRLLSGTPDEADSFGRLDRLLDAQAYRLAYWRVAADEINYRRFFNIN